MTKRTKPHGGMQPNNELSIEQSKNETGAKALARNVVNPGLRHAVTTSSFANKVFGDTIEHPGLMDYTEHLIHLGAKAESGDMAMASRMLASQAVTLDAMFTEMARRSAVNMGEYPQASERYGRLAMKAQSNCRATLETLAKLHQPREQTVRHVHVNEGGQAVIADQVHHHAGGAENAKSNEQSHTAGSAGTSLPLPSPDALGNGMPIPGGVREAPVSNARRD